ncbi:MAG: serine hydrolase [Peptococcaceae bacterium]|jgi:D-alanyl-D-alanine carboxypeptidase (penicillin-binding protein 5/6)|nr:serine hydrolase [Peptococcaceae bacterium]
MRFKRLAIFLVVIFAILTYILWLSEEPNVPDRGSTPGSASSADPANPVNHPDSADAGSTGETPLSYYVYNIQTNKVIAYQNQDLQRAPASTTKLLTGLVVIDAWDLDEIITVHDEVRVDGSGLGLAPGDKISLNQLLTAMYLVSANDAATALAVKAAGSIDEFSEYMNEYATKIGCTGSHFSNPHGLPDPDHYTTAQDMAKIAGQFIKDERLLALAQTKTATIRWQNQNGQTRSAQISNTNQLLGVYPGVAGLKTGTTTEAGQCLVTYFKHQDAALLVVVLGAKQRYQTTLPLLDQAVQTEVLTQDTLTNLSKNPAAWLDYPGIY